MLGVMIFLLWVEMAVISGCIANQKNHGTGISYFLGGLVFGPPLVLVAMTLDQLPSWKRKTEDMKECPACAEWVKSAAVICRYCRTYFEKEVEPNPQ